MVSTYGTIIQNLTKSLNERVRSAIEEDNRNYYISIHVYDLLGIVALRPLYSEWFNIIRPKDLIMTDELESFIFKECIEYAMNNTELKFTSGADLFMVYLRLAIKEKFKIDIATLTPTNSLFNRYFKMYLTTLCGKLNKITHYAPIMCDSIESNIDLLKYPTIKDYFEVNEVPLYEIADLNVSFANNKFIGLLHLIIFAKV